MTLYEEVTAVLEESKNFSQNGKLLKNIVVEASLKLDKNLLSILLKNPTCKKHFFVDVEGLWVFDKIKFQKFVSNKQFLPDSFTAFKNKIGLTDDEQYLSHSKQIVLDFPFKDCVLEGGQTREEQSQQEIFYNEILAPEAIDKMLQPKVMTQFKKYDETGSHEVDSVTIHDNLLIKGNNLIALHSIRKKYFRKIKLIYIDPPYNTGGDGFNYNDSFNHASWLTFMKNRLEVAKELLTPDGSLWINIDDREGHYLKVLCDEIMGRDNFVINFIWQKKYSPSNDAKYFSDNHDHILVFAKDKSQFKAQLLPRTEKMNERYKNIDNDPRGPWKPGGFSVKTYSKDYDYPIETHSGKIVHPPSGSCWQTSKENYLKKLADNRIWFGVKGDAKPQIKQFLTEVQQGMVAKSIWLHDEVGHNQVARSEILKYFGEYKFATPKPESLLKRIIELGTQKDDIVLDFFAGSGTTLAVAMKLRRRFIGIEQMDYIEDVTAERLRKVIQGMEVGISNEVEWKGGGDFVYCELLKMNQIYIDAILKAKTYDELLDLYQKIKLHSIVNYQVDITLLDNMFKDNETHEIPTLKKMLLSIFDHNMNYVPVSEMEDKDYSVSEMDKKCTRLFYNMT